MKKKSKLVFLGKIEDFNSEDSIAYWQEQAPEVRLKATWELVVNAWKIKGRDLNELRFRRDTSVFKRPKS